ncbi:kelch-like protein 7 [Oculina patagonica]
MIIMSLDLLSQPITEAEEQQFCVEMMKRLDIQRRNEQFCDVILEVGSGDDQARLKAHRIVLCAASPFFYNALNSEMKEKKEGVIKLEETSKAEMEEVLEYLYTGHVDINEHNAFDLLQIADFLIIPSLKKLSSKFISQTLSSSNCIKAYYFAERYQCPELQKSARDLTFANFMDVTQSDAFLDLSVTQVVEWVSSDDITVKAEEEVFQVIVKWMERDESRKHQNFLELFCHIRLIYVSRSFVFNVILPHPLVKDSASCTGLVHDAMKELSNGTEECYFVQPPRRCLKTHEDAIVACGMKTKQTLCYLPSENKWYKMAGMMETVSRQNHLGSTISTCHGKLYIATQSSAGECTVERYDPSGNSWAPVKSFAGATMYKLSAVVSFRGFLYVVGGNKENETDHVHKYNPDTNLWQEVAPMSIARCCVCAVADSNSLYAIGGLSQNVTLDVVEKFDPEKNCWKRIASTLEKKWNACGAVVRGKVFLFGGFTDSESITSYSNLIEMYDPSTNMWSSIEHMGAPIPPYIFSAVNFKGKVFVIGASRGARRFHSFSLQAYDVDKNEWEYCSFIAANHRLFSVAALRIPRDILDKCEVVPQG